MVSKEEKINNIISELDRQVDGIKQFSNVLEQIKLLSNSTQKLSEQVLTNSEKYINITNQLDDSLSMIKEHIEKVSTTSELRLKNIQNNSLQYYKKLLENTTRIIQEIGHKIIDSNATINKQIEFIEVSIKKDIKEVSDDLNLRFSDMENKLDEYQSILVQSNSANTKKLMLMIIGVSIWISALVITGHYEWLLEFMNKMFS